MLAGVEEETDGVEGGVQVLMAPWRDPFGELDVIMGEGMLYLQGKNIPLDETEKLQRSSDSTFCAPTAHALHPLTPTGLLNS